MYELASSSHLSPLFLLCSWPCTSPNRETKTLHPSSSPDSFQCRIQRDNQLGAFLRDGPAVVPFPEGSLYTVRRPLQHDVADGYERAVLRGGGEDAVLLREKERGAEGGKSG